MPPMRMVHLVDPAKELLSKIGDLSGFELFGNQVLIAIYERPEKTKSGIILADVTRQEDAFQGKAGLVVKLGPDAFEDTADYTFNFEDNRRPKVGDWVVYKVGDAWSLNVKEYPCRYIRDVGIKMIVDDPGIIF